MQSSSPTTDAPDAPWMQTYSGRAFNLLNPTPDMVDFHDDIPVALSRIARFNGATLKQPYSVAQHCCLGADYIYSVHNDFRLAQLFLLHDAHEAYLGDIISPVAKALQEHCFLGNDSVVDYALSRIKIVLNKTIWRAAEIASPCLQEEEHLKAFDLAMLATERKFLMRETNLTWEATDGVAIIPLKKDFRIWRWEQARDEYDGRLRFYFPHLFKNHAGANS